MKITKQEDLKIGQWSSDCCERDLREIKSQEDIEDIIEMWDDIGTDSVDVWESKKEALLDIRSTHSPTHEYGKHAISVIDEMIAQIE